MGDTKISSATLTTPATTDLIPLARPADTTARHATIASVVRAVVADTSAAGSVELATNAEVQAGSNATLAVTPKGLAAYFDQTLVVGDNLKLRLPVPIRTEYFQMHTYEVTFDGVNDPVMTWGWNIGGAGLIDPTQGAIWQQFEYDYFVDAKHVMEWNFNATDDNANSERFLNFVINKTNIHEAYWWFWIGNTGTSFFQITDVVTEQPILEIYTKSDYPLFRVTGIAATTTEYYAIVLNPTIVSSVNDDIFGTEIEATITVGDGDNISSVCTLRVEAPTITITGGSTLYYPSTLQITGPPTVGAYPWSLWVESGYVLFGGNVAFGGVATDRPVDPVDIVTGTLRQRVEKTPSSASDTGRVGQFCWDTNYIYICTAANTWKRAAIATW